MSEKNFICVACPMGCELRVTLDEAGGVTNVQGNNCKRGVAYATAEVTHPTRSFHSTVRVEGGETPLVSVKPREPVPKALLQDCAAATRNALAKAPVAIGDVLLANVCGSGVDLIATNRCGVLDNR